MSWIGNAMAVSASPDAGRLPDLSLEGSAEAGLGLVPHSRCCLFDAGRAGFEQRRRELLKSNIIA
jgi:hypothetical protein